MIQTMKRIMCATLLLVWVFTTLSFSVTAAAQDLTMSQVDPQMLLAQYSPSKVDSKKTEAVLQRYAKGSKYVIIGRVQSTNRLSTGGYLDLEAYVEVDGWLRGKPEDEAPTLLRIEKQYNAPYIADDWETVTGVLVEGYSVIIFLDQDFGVVEGNAIFYNDGSYYWRNKRNNNFLHPHYDREWDQENPYDDYVVIPHQDVKKMLEKQRAAQWLR